MPSVSKGYPSSQNPLPASNTCETNHRSIFEEGSHISHDLFARNTSKVSFDQVFSRKR